MPHAAKHSESPIEVLMFEALMRTRKIVLVEGGNPEGEGLFLYPQQQFGPFRADFLLRVKGYPEVGPKLWPPKLEVSLCIECDGKEFHGSLEAQERDKRRDAYFASKNIKTVRFSGADIYANADFCAECVVHEAVEALKGCKVD
jgi:hypothetical protein